MRTLDDAQRVWGGKGSNEALLLYHLGSLDSVPGVTDSEEFILGGEVVTETYSVAEFYERHAAELAALNTEVPEDD